jgi:uncharacterized membrane protein
MITLIAGLVLFLGCIPSPSLPAWRDRMAARLGHGWRGVYAMISVIGFVLIIRGYAAAQD